MTEPEPVTIPGLRSPQLLHAFSTLDWGSMVSADLRRRFVAAAGLDGSQVALARAVHGADVAVVRSPGPVEAVDGLITERPRLGLMLLLADCYGVVLHDPRRGVLGLVHSGWRGTAGRVVEVALGIMERDFNCHPEDVVAGIGPGICGACYEVGEDVGELFDSAFTRPSGAGRILLDLRACITAQLLRSGLGSDHVHAHGACTREDAQFPSHRRAATGERFACLAAMI